MKVKNPLRKLTLSKTTIAHLADEQMIAARGGSCGDTIWETYECVQANSACPPILVT